MIDYKDIIQKIGTVGMVNLFLSLNSIILLPIVTKKLPIEDYGIWSQVLATLGILPLIAVLGLPYSMSRFMASARKKEDIKEVFYTCLFIAFLSGLTISFVISLFSEKISSSLFNSEKDIVKILSLIIFVESINILFLNYFRARQQIKKYSIFIVVQTFIHIGLTYLLVMQGKGIYGAIIAIMIRVSVSFALMSFVIISEIGIKVPKLNNLKQYLSLGVPTIPGELSTWIVNSSDRYLIGLLLGSSFVGYYSPSYMIANNIIYASITPILFVLPPILSKYYEEKKLEDVKRIVEYSIKYFLILAIPITFGMSLLSKPILTILTTEEIASKGYLVMPFIAISTVLFGVSIIIQQIAILKKKTKVIGKIWIISAIINIIFNIILIPIMGIIGAALTTMIVFLFSLILSVRYCSQLIKFNVDSLFLFKVFFASVSMCLIIIKLSPSSVFELALTVGICVLVYITILILLNSFSIEEKNFFKKLIHQLTKYKLNLLTSVKGD